MLLGWRIFVHAVRIVVMNIGPALRISVVPYVVVFGLAFYVSTRVAPGLFPPGATEAQGTIFLPDAPAFLLVPVIFVAFATVYLWVVIGWHRFILLDEQPGAVTPKWHGTRMLSYLWAVVRLVFAMLVLSIPALFVMFGLSVSDSALVMTVGAFIVQLALSAAVMLFSLILPAAAIGHPMGLTHSSGYTWPVKGAILTVAVLVNLVALIPSVLLLTPLAPVLNTVAYQVIVSWFGLMFGISVLTTLYGVLVENRDLP
ncbi:MAG: hypothetical protein AAGF74_15890 [Pseudomonadota bacterium]